MTKIEEANAKMKMYKDSHINIMYEYRAVAQEFIVRRVGMRYVIIGLDLVCSITYQQLQDFLERNL